jgi:UDP-N-acetylmuramoyl-L-alanyl-D-glutamate--2,6-diaminopimelate ligase
MRLIEFAKLLNLERGDGPLDCDVNGVAWDCRRVSPGNLFVAIPGPGRAMDQQIETAIERGAAAVLCEGGEVVSRRVTRLQVASVRAALPRVAELFFGQPDRRLVVIGVAGSSNNTAPAMLLKTILDAAAMKCGHIGAAGCEIGERQLPPLRKNSEGLDYFELMAQMVRAGCAACIIEFGPDAIEQKRLAGIAFDLVIFGSFNLDIISGRGAAMVQFCRTLSNGPKRFTGVFNIDDEVSQALFESGACKEQVSFGFNGAAEVRGTNVELEAGTLGMVVAAGTTEIRLRTKLTGRQTPRTLCRLAQARWLAGFRCR